MSLKGTLGSFSIADIFQLIGHQQKSGILFVRSPQSESRFFFSEGKVVLATMTGARQDLLLGSLLLRAGAVTKTQLEQALLTQKSAPKSLGEILVSQKALEVSVLKEFLALQLDEILTEVIQWDAGSYEFVPEKITFNTQLLSPRGTEGLLMECFQRKDEWPMIIQKISSPLSTFKKKSAAANPPENLDDSEKKLLLWLDSGKNLKEISFTSRMGTFETCRAAAALLDKGLISPEGQTTQYEASDHQLGVTVDYRQIVLLTLMGFALGSFLGSPRSFNHIKTYPGKTSLGRPLLLDFSPSHFLKNEERIRLEQLKNEFFLSQGKYPTSLNELNVESANYEIKTIGDTSIVFPK